MTIVQAGVAGATGGCRTAGAAGLIAGAPGSSGCRAHRRVSGLAKQRLFS